MSQPSTQDFHDQLNVYVKTFIRLVLIINPSRNIDLDLYNYISQFYANSNPQCIHLPEVFITACNQYYDSYQSFYYTNFTDSLAITPEDPAVQAL
jgi:phosphomevalonate kinase